MSTLATSIIINEVFPNPSIGSEWVEILQIGENPTSSGDYVGFTISDEARVIYQFSGDENWLEKLLLIELSGLNNDGDSVILKNADGLVVDQMTYSNSQKDLSWLRTNIESPLFTLGEPNPLALNIIPQPSTEPTIDPSHTPVPTVVSNQKSDDKQNQETEQKLELNQTKKTIIEENTMLNEQDILEKYFRNYQNFKNLRIECQNTQHFPNPRLVFLGQRVLKTAVLNAIIGSSLLIIAAILLSYEQSRKH